MADAPHPEAQALLDARSDAPPLHALSIEDLRGGPAPDDEGEPVADVTDVVVPGKGHGIPVRLYTPDGSGPFPVFVWAHGGGSILGSIEAEEPKARALANATDCIVASVEYRLAPEHPFPAPVWDYLDVLDWVEESAAEVVDHSGELVVGGESAGAKLAAASAHYIRDHGGPAIDYQVLAYPSVNYSREFASVDEYDGYFIHKETIPWLHEQYLDDPMHGHNPYAFPLEDSEFGELPPVTLIAAGFDPLRDSVEAYGQELVEAGVKVRQRLYEDMIHAFLGNVEWERSQEAMADIGEDIRAALD